MRIGIIGVGGIGGYFGGRLHESGADVHFIARPATLAKLQSDGLTLVNDAGDVTTCAVQASLAEDAPEVDILISATKALDGEAGFELLAPLCGPTTTVVTTQNWVEAPLRAAESLPTDRIWPGIARGYFHRTGPTRVEFHGGPLSLTFGSWSGEHDGQINEFAQLLQQAGINAVIHSDIFVDLWEKAMFVGPQGALGSLADATLGQLCGELRTEFAAFIAEVATVGRASGVRLPETVVEATLAFADKMPATATSSMQRDLAAGQANELDAQVGAIVRLGAQHAVPTPRHELALALLARRSVERPDALA